MYWYFAASGAGQTPPALEELQAAGVPCQRLNDAAPSGPGVFFFEETNEDVCALLRDLSAGGAEILALCLSQTPPSARTCWGLLAAGASDVLSRQPAGGWTAKVRGRLNRWRAVAELLESPLIREHLVGHSRPWRRALRQAIQMARFTDAPVLITGETGTGKELVARLIHTLDPRPEKRDLIVLDCATIVPTLSGSEFFGHERGAYTGAVGPREGAFALAHNGTLFVDEVGDLPPELQAQLLRVIQEGSYKRVGGNSWRETRFRLVCATNRNLAQMAERGEFRRDLYYRIAAGTCHLPPLRERPEDILPLARYFLGILRPGAEVEMDPAVQDYLLRREYPGNVRELRQLVTRMSYRDVGVGPLSAGDLPSEDRQEMEVFSLAADAAFERAIQRALTCGEGLREISRIAGEVAIRLAVGEEDGNLQRASRRLGVTDRALQLRRSVQKEKHRHQQRAAASP